MNFTKQQEELYAQLIQRAWEDPVFKQQLVDNPVATIEAEIGQKLNIPEGKTLVAVDQTEESTIYLNIPAELEMDNVELNDEQLEAVAGGAQKMFFIPGGNQFLEIIPPFRYDPAMVGIVENPNVPD